MKKLSDEISFRLSSVKQLDANIEAFILSGVEALERQLETKLTTLRKEAERHRADYEQRCALRMDGMTTESRDYWRGRRDEAGFWRDRLEGG